MARPPLPIVIHSTPAAASAPSPEALWRSLEERSGHAAAPAQHTHADAFSGARRDFMKLMAASLALAGAGCSRPPPQKIVPYVHEPVGLTQGEPLYFATVLCRDGYAIGVLAKSAMGRPIKIEGNPAHPASLGATDIFAQAAVLELWDPDRSRTVLQQGEPATWEALLETLQSRLHALEGAQGKGLHVLTGTVGSPSLLAQFRALQQKYPQSAWHVYQPAHRDNVHEGSRLAFGEVVETIYRFDRARAILALDADFLGALPGCVRYACDFAQARRIGEPRSDPCRLYAVECTPTLTGAAADHRLALRPREVQAFAQAVAHRLGALQGAPEPTSVVDDTWLGALVTDLQRHRGASLVLAGDRQPPYVHALAHAMNAALGSAGTTLDYITPVAQPGQQQAIHELTGAMIGGEVDTLIVLGRNPVYDAPADLGFRSALARVGLAVHVGLHVDETAARCHWHVPAAHELESWGDARAFDGTIALQQPLVAPLYDGKSAYEILAALSGDPNPRGYDVVRSYWQQHAGAGDFEHFWETALHKGVVEGSAFAPKRITLKRDLSRPAGKPTDSTADAGLDIVFECDPTLGDGRWANNAWLQELPKPITQLTWDNAVLLSARTAAARRVAPGDIVELTCEGRRTRVPAWIVPGHPDDVVTVYLGSGRTRAGRVGNGVGFNAYALRTAAAPWFGSGATLSPTGERRDLATTQVHHRMEGRSIVRSATLAEFRQQPDFAIAPDERGPEPSLYPPYAYPGYAWGMSIDLDACIGCNACTIACQAENNIPVVGKRAKSVAAARCTGSASTATTRAPAETAAHATSSRCPACTASTRPARTSARSRRPCTTPKASTCRSTTAASARASARTTVRTRCAASIFCSIRRRRRRASTAQRNPEVTVRMRGVMEKCTYCVQRIASARIEADGRIGASPTAKSSPPARPSARRRRSCSATSTIRRARSRGARRARSTTRCWPSSTRARARRYLREGAQSQSGDPMMHARRAGDAAPECTADVTEPRRSAARRRRCCSADHTTVDHRQDRGHRAGAPGRAGLAGRVRRGARC